MLFSGYKSTNIINKSVNSRAGSAAWVLIEIFFIVLSLSFFLGIAQKWLFVKVPVSENTVWSKDSLKKTDSGQIGNINVLVMGVDSVEGTHRADTIFVLGINPSKSKVTMLSIPRDTRVLISGRARKINEVLPRYGEPALRALIEDLMQVKISRFVKVDFQGFINIIDALGGVEINIAKSMHYDDNWGKLHIHFNKGLNKLSGKQSLNYVRFRADANADLGRIKRQQKFIKVLVQKMATPGFVVKLPTILKEAIKHVNTDFSLSEIFSIIYGFKDFKVKMKTASLPGEARYINRISYFLPYKDKSLELGARDFSDLAALELVASFSSNKKME